MKQVINKKKTRAPRWRNQQRNFRKMDSLFLGRMYIQ